MTQQIFLFGESLGYHFTILDIGGGFPGTTDSAGFFAQLAGVLNEGLGQRFSGRPDLKIIAEPGMCKSANPDTNGAEESVIVSEVCSFQRLKCMHKSGTWSGKRLFH